MITTGTEITYKELGVVRFVVRPTSRHISARWRNGKIVCNVPPGITRKEACNALESMSDALNSNRPVLKYREDDILQFEGWNVRFCRHASHDDRIFAFPSTKDATLVEVPADFNFNAPDSTRRISSILCKIAQSIAPALLIPAARETASRIQRHPLRWKISHGHRTLGCCNSRGEISLSYMVAFLPRHLRDYIICHELAHLSEMNHSPRFHQLCDSYCEGKEKQYIEELKHFRWPILK